ncbi:MAG TPA: alpha/beta fold hydrolase [Candidatus Dormibacteraeota bacterium]|nr:alpha/beta fold hydrolase [Candidatus Dormibacteraeota bacterium]
MPGPRDGWLQRDGIDIHYLEWTPEQAAEADSAAPVLLLHGLGSDAHYWDRVAGRLPERRLVALDQRGHGLTGRPPHSPAVPEGFATDELLEDAIFTCERLGLHRPVVVGHSWGATVSLELVARNRDFASALVFIDGPVQSAANLFAWDEAQKVMQPPLPRYASVAEAIADARKDFGESWADDLEPFVIARLVQDGADLVLTLTAEIRLALLRGLYESPVDQLWTALDVPAIALIARGDSERVSSWKERGGLKLKQIAPDVDVRWFDTPHDIPVFAPKEVAELIRTATDPASQRAGSEAAAGQ